MTYAVSKASDINYVEVISFDSLADMHEWINSVGYPVIIEHNPWFNHHPATDVAECFRVPFDMAVDIACSEWHITIYDDYLE